jgi:hypothetical protein
MLASAVIAGLKGKYGLVALGLLIHLTWYVGAIRPRQAELSLGR